MKRFRGTIPTTAALAAAAGLALAAGSAGAQAARLTSGGDGRAASRDETRRPSAIGEVVVRGPVGGADVIREARRHLGVRYKWGGATPRAFDCSGFIQYVFAQYGIALPRTAREQAGVGVAPFPGDLQPGDLLFFYGGRGAQHIALYVGGDTIIHASSTGGRVRLDRLSGPRSKPTWYRRRLIAVRRVLPAEGIFRLPSSTSGPAAASVAAADGGRPRS